MTKWRVCVGEVLWMWALRNLVPLPCPLRALSTRSARRVSPRGSASATNPQLSTRASCSKCTAHAWKWRVWARPRCVNSRRPTTFCLVHISMLVLYNSYIIRSVQVWLRRKPPEHFQVTRNAPLRFRTSVRTRRISRPASIPSRRSALLVHRALDYQLTHNFLFLERWHPDETLYAVL